MEYAFEVEKALEGKKIPRGLSVIRDIKLTNKQYQKLNNAALRYPNKLAVLFETYTNHRAFETSAGKSINLTIIGYTRGNRQYRINKTVFAAFI